MEGDPSRVTRCKRRGVSIYGGSGVRVNIRSSDISYNQDSSEGGGLFVGEMYYTIIRDCTFIENQSPRGSAIVSESLKTTVSDDSNRDLMRHIDDVTCSSSTDGGDRGEGREQSIGVSSHRSFSHCHLIRGPSDGFGGLPTRSSHQRAR